MSKEKERRMFVGVVWNCAAELKLLLTALLFLCSLITLLHFIPSRLITFSPVDLGSCISTPTASLHFVSHLNATNSSNPSANTSTTTPPPAPESPSLEKDRLLQNGVVKRAFNPFGSAAYNFILMSAYRGGYNTFAVMGLGSKPLHVYGKPSYRCEWVSSDKQKTPISVVGHKILPDWGYGRVYTVIVINCTFPVPVGNGETGGKLLVHATTNGGGDTNFNTTDTFEALSETGQDFVNFTSGRSVRNPVAVLLDSGNLVVKEANDDNPENFLWQSFNYPTDTHLPGMKIGKNFKTGHELYLSSWKNDNDPAPGEFTRSIDPTGYPQILTKSGTNVLYRVGPWNGLKWSGAPIPLLQQSRLYRFQFAFNEEGIYYIFSLINHSSILSRMVMTSNGDIQRFVWVDQTKRWHIHYRLPADNCDTYSLCGVYGRCDIDNEPICGCLEMFVPKYSQQWGKGDWTKGCVRRTPLDCNRKHVFIKYPGVKLPDTKHSQYNKTMTLEGCKQVCSTDCSCTAYSSLNISNGNKGCLLWFEELVDIRKLSEGGQDIFIKMDSSEQLADLQNIESKAGSNRKKAKILAVSFSLLVATILLILILLLYKRKKKKLKLREDFELPLIPLSTITRATNNFSVNNKIGEGGFGPVYKGVLEEGQEIAVKRRSRTSMHGLDEYTNEVIYIAKLQHRNLVRLLGCCIQGEEKMLIYEYMPNNSLDSYIFDQTKSKLLDWPKRFHIINGIARGLLYLHQDSRLRIIHRDLKASNVLLDMEMNPKISDFGMARSVTGNEMGAKTGKVVGTHGYMSPEYAVDGMFSVKSDVFSFGVLVLEIVSGKKNRGFSHQDHNLNLLGHAWKLYKEDRSLELADEQLADSCKTSQILRSIQVGLLCVQQHPNDRPSMFSVVQMLANESLLPKAKEPGFFTERNVYDEGKSGSQTTSSKNEVTITLLDPR